MSKYRGADGWLQDDSVGKPQRFQNKDNLNPKEQRKEDPPEDPPPVSCPNCNYRSGWLRLENRCTHCGWGKGSKKSSNSPNEDGFCCAFIGLCTVSPLVGAGMGYATMGFGGLLAGVGLGIALPISLSAYALMSSNSSKKDPK